MKKVLLSFLAFCLTIPMLFAVNKTLDKPGPDFICHDDMFGPIYSLNKYIVDTRIIPVDYRCFSEGTAAHEIPFLCMDSWLVGCSNAQATGFEAENLAFPRHSSHIPGGAEQKQGTSVCFKVKTGVSGTFFGMDVIFHQCATTVMDQVLPGSSYLPIYLIDDVFGITSSAGELVVYMCISPDLGILLRGPRNNRLGPWDYFVVCDLDPNDYDNDGYYEAALGFRSSPVNVSPINEWGNKAIDGEIGCAIMTHILLNPPPGEGKLLGANFDVMDPQPYWPAAGMKHSEALAGESEFSRPWCITVYSDGV